MKGAEIIMEKPTGMMPHALIIMFGDQVKAWRVFDEIASPDVRKVTLVDTYCDEKFEAIKAAEALKGRLNAVQLDTPGSRRGNFEIIREVRWDLAVRGYKNVRIFVSGGLDEEKVTVLGEGGAEAFGVRTSVGKLLLWILPWILSSLRINLWQSGGIGGKKQVWRCPKCLVDTMLAFKLSKPECPEGGGETEPMLKTLIKQGKIVAELPTPREISRYVLEQIEKVTV